MKIKIETTEPVTKTIDVEFPYYYKHDLLPDGYSYIIYGKVSYITGGSCCIREELCDTRKSYSTESEENISISRFVGYFTDEYKSTKEEFEAAKKRAIDFLRHIPE